MTVDEIRELVQLLSESDITELEVQRGEDRVRISRSGGSKSAAPGSGMHYSSAPPPSGTGGHQQFAQGPSPQALAPQQAPEPPKAEPTDDPSVKLVKSPIVGTFYESGSPGSPPFVRVGETVQAGRVLCIIESMKLMNEIEAEFAGVIVAKLVPNGQPVEYGEALFSIRAI
ncbi:acetyl-CoA carboxylase biotin carboxyl carrier protein [Nevskia soli]|jgi:acetyl-CoA carboxylase biotin carboxyl carrier protein|uniref:acetyl-CoA carboxylase biotin carboxyl carrier protein n=1 Tax=Nevskia soli TaxID=418856 RepID=UPI0015D6F7A7|nr:acetyl-CoA carboxylase biotin carboxyl carrier protein [Nevskia soli]